jgi:hypothetical protein
MGTGWHQNPWPPCPCPPALIAADSAVLMLVFIQVVEVYIIYAVNMPHASREQRGQYIISEWHRRLFARFFKASEQHTTALNPMLVSLFFSGEYARRQISTARLRIIGVRALICR